MAGMSHDQAPRLLRANAPLLLLGILMSSCGGHCPPTTAHGTVPEPKETAMSNEKSNIQVVIRAFTPNAVSDTYDDGSFASYDVSTIEILAPKRLAGRTLDVLHDVEPAPSSPWRQVDARLCFHAREGDLEDTSTTLFIGALSEPCQ